MDAVLVHQIAWVFLVALHLQSLQELTVVSSSLLLLEIILPLVSL